MSPTVGSAANIRITVAATAPTVSVGAATIAWGPDFGNPTELEGGVTVTMPTLALDTTDMLVGQTVTMPSLALNTTDLAVGGALRMPELALNTTDMLVGQTVTMPAVALNTTDMLVGGSPTMPALALNTTDLQVGVAPRLTALALDAPTDLAVGTDFGAVNWITGQRHTDQEVWWDELAACVGTTNHPNENLRIDGAVATRKDALIKWDLSGFPTNATVTGATMRIHLAAAGGVLNRTLQIRRVSTANNAGGEGWSEVDVDCNANPAVQNTSTQAFTITPGTGNRTIILNAAWRTAIQNRMGNGNMSMYFTLAAADTEMTIVGSDASTLRPRLSFSFTTPS